MIEETGTGVDDAVQAPAAAEEREPRTFEEMGLRPEVIQAVEAMGFNEEISEILKRCPTERQTLLFSATIPEEIERISKRYMRDAEKIVLSADYVGVHEIAHAYYMVSGMGRVRDLQRVLGVEKP